MAMAASYDGGGGNEGAAGVPAGPGAGATAPGAPPSLSGASSRRITTSVGMEREGLVMRTAVDLTGLSFVRMAVLVLCAGSGHPVVFDISY